MNSLNAFLNPVCTEKTKEIVISDRFVGEDGKPAKMTIKTITQAENRKLLAASTHPKKDDRGNTYESLDHREYQARLIVECTVIPDFKNTEICSKYGVVDPLEVPERMLFNGEYAFLSQSISDLSGFKSAEELSQSAKNS